MTAPSMSDPENDDISRTFGVWVAGVQDRLSAYLIASIGHRADADDVLQEVNLVLWRKRCDFEPGTSFWAWAQRVAFFQIMAFRKRRQRDRLVFDDDVIHLLATEAAPLLLDVEMPIARLPACLELLPERQRRVIEDHYYSHQSLKDLAASHDSTPAAIGQLLYRARLNLHRCLNQSAD